MGHNFEHLPMELIKSIVPYIDAKNDLFQCTLINRWFYTAAIAKLWHTPGLAQLQGDDVINTKHILTILNYSRRHPQRHLRSIPIAHHIRKLSFTENDQVRDIVKLLERAPLVQEIKINQCILSDEDMFQFAENCPQLKKLTLRSTRITDTAMMVLAHFCPLLCSLQLRECNHLTFITLMALKSCPLESFGLWDCKLLDAYVAVEPLLKLCTLKELNLRGFSSDIMDKLIRRATATKGWSQLETFFLDNCRDRVSPQDDRTMSLFFQSHPTLKCIGLSGPWIGDISVLSFPTTLPRLWRLVLAHNTQISTHALRNVAKNCPHLEIIVLMACGFTTEHFPETGDRYKDKPFRALLKDDIQRIRQDSASGQGSTTVEDNVVR